MEWHAHPMEHVKDDVIAALIGGHQAVLVYFVCGKCGKENKCTYELTDVGKESRWGYYGRCIGICADTELHVSYKIVELIFDGMWKGYHLVDANCQHWARDFYIRGIKIPAQKGRDPLDAMANIIMSKQQFTKFIRQIKNRMCEM
uniref:LRAT domain-containing protein n=1 Tax=Globodera pallida TaxID=36090 RepID=A0A183CEL4_GLOPA